MSYLYAIIWAALFSLLLIIITCIRRVYFHPLTGFPGPRTASFTAWYGFYFDVVKGGIGIKRFPSLHQRYGNSCSRWNILEEVTSNSTIQVPLFV